MTDQSPPSTARRLRRAEPPATGSHRRPGNRHAHQRLRNGLPHANQRAGADGHLQGSRRGPGHVRGQPGEASFANNCLLARRLAERDVRFVQLYHRDWDHHSNLPRELKEQCRLTDRPAAALVRDLKQRGLLDDTLVIWGGEFGRTAFGQGKIEANNFGRDHHPRCFTMWMAGGGIKPGITLGKSDEFGYNVVEDPVPVHDFQATLLTLPRRRSHEADVPLAGPGLPSHRRRRRSGHQALDVTGKGGTGPGGKTSTMASHADADDGRTDAGPYPHPPGVVPHLPEGGVGFRRRPRHPGRPGRRAGPQKEGRYPRRLPRQLCPRAAWFPAAP